MNPVKKDTLVKDLRALGLARGDWVVVHSSMKAIGWVDGGPAAVIEALRVAVDAPRRGHLLMPLLCKPPRPGEELDLATAPTYLGLLPETFRQWPGVVRSHHPTHSVGILGPRAEEVAESHRNSTFVGRGSPYHLLAEAGGWVLHIGTDFSTSTILHLAEVLADVPYLEIGYEGWDVPIAARAADGRRVVSLPLEMPGDSVQFYLVREEMERQGLLRRGPVGNAPSLLSRGRDMLEVAIPMMRRDPGQFLCHIEDCTLCPRRRELVRRWEESRRLVRKELIDGRTA